MNGSLTRRLCMGVPFVNCDLYRLVISSSLSSLSSSPSTLTVEAEVSIRRGVLRGLLRGNLEKRRERTGLVLQRPKRMTNIRGPSVGGMKEERMNRRGRGEKGERMALDGQGTRGWRGKGRAGLSCHTYRSYL